MEDAPNPAALLIETRMSVGVPTGRLETVMVSEVVEVSMFKEPFGTVNQAEPVLVSTTYATNAAFLSSLANVGCASTNRPPEVIGVTD